MGDDPETRLAALEVLKYLRPDATGDLFAEVLRSTDDAAYVVTEVNRQVVAVIGWRIRVSTRWGRHLYIDDLVVLPEFRGQGHGQSLLDRALREARKASCSAVVVDTATGTGGAALALCRAAGLVESGIQLHLELTPNAPASQPVHDA
ncbi:GNAT family N-acetyltransferase [Nocardioides sp. 1609]|uniref:GNAT family N-acetyltransferase n=1 Tax=Nocardioides sp. 1609 TaxID=2508327 RepID=UPI0014322299|nr:GNAT family N-acetyltransferase [Nocardioides sp. 1609]